jgi:hypothetical protein
MYYPQCHGSQPGIINPLYYHPSAPAPIVAPVKKFPNEYPDIVSWCQYLDAHHDQNQDDIIFSPYSALLEKKGFIHIMQLTLESFSLRDLQEWLGIEVGTAILIMQYAKADIKAIKTGKLIFPTDE